MVLSCLSVRFARSFGSPIVLFFFVVVLAGPSHLLATGIQITSAPTVALQPNAPLSALLEFSTDVPTRFSLRAQGPNNEAWKVESNELRTDHAIPLLGFAPDSSYTIDKLIVTENGGGKHLIPDPLGVMSDTLPADFGSLVVHTRKPTMMEPGYTMANNRTSGYTFAADDKGTVRWYTLGSASDIRRQDDGLLLMRLNGSVREMDFLGNVHRAWHPTGDANAEILPGSVPVTSLGVFHHDIFPQQDGNFLAIDRGIKPVENFPTSDTDPNAPTETRNIVYDIVREFAPDGTVTNSWDLSEILDTTRITYNPIEQPGNYGWSHTNAVIHDPRDDSIILSLRNQDAVIKLSQAG